ncbi:MAG: tail protein X [Burkholderiales bacterium]|nr:tail protein X [Burkholderiales bacterium]
MSQGINDGTTTVYSQAGETLDCVLYRLRRNDSRDEIMTLNPTLARLPAVLPEYTAIRIPETQPTTTQTILPSISLWD